MAKLLVVTCRGPAGRAFVSASAAESQANACSARRQASANGLLIRFNLSGENVRGNVLMEGLASPHFIEEQ
ncbi:MAG: hypothetical protein NT167_26735, partial [Verrucomicrobia bacterium]|nr:hypothetical protein [Verrucomicrobiota bacterium]